MDLVYQKVHRTIRALEHFTMNEWTYQSDHLLLLNRAVQASYAMASQGRDAQLETVGGCKGASGEPEGALPSEETHPAFSYYTVNGTLNRALYGEAKDQETPFPMDLSALDWADYFRDYVLGIRRYLLKEDEATLPEARKTLLM